MVPRLISIRKNGPETNTPDFISHPMLSLAARNPALVTSRDTIATLALTLRRLAYLQEFLRMYIDLETSRNPSTMSFEGVRSAAQLRPIIEERAKSQAAWAYSALCQLVPLLRAERGAMPAPRAEPVTSLTEIPQDPDPFVT